MYNGRKVAVLIAAAGTGNRFGAETPKQFVQTGGNPMYLSAARPFIEHEAVDELVFIFPDGYNLPEEIEISKPHTSVRGGASRRESVNNGLAAVSFESGIVLIHDAARPFVTNRIIDRVLDAAAQSGAAVPCVTVTDTIYRTDELWTTASGELPKVDKIPDRNLFFAAQTPQCFDLEMIRSAHKKAAEAGESAATDDVGIAIKYAGAQVQIAQGNHANRKITYAADMPDYRIGTGFDVHELADERKLILGGVEIPFPKGLLGHSDADVLTHALMDALLGALALGDIGKLFPDTDEKYRGISSMKLLSEVMKLVREHGFGVVNADLTVIADRPKISLYSESIRKSLSAAMGIKAERVSVKATTTEGLGFTGREEGIAAEAVVLINKEAI
jgi:2-C-methyl-D-erythritol 2,4-cyclodiphosphate synthase/2-C-methyl-D-erythritol 4-phosphate cytidylyltransferase